MNPRTKVIDTKATTAAEFVSGATPGPVLQPPAAAAAASAPVPGPTPEPLPAPVPPDAADAAFAAAAAASAPVAPAAKTDVETDPFVLLWRHPKGVYSVRAMEVPGGCIVARAMADTPVHTIGLVFVPNLKIEAGQLVAA